MESGKGGGCGEEGLGWLGNTKCRIRVAGWQKKCGNQNLKGRRGLRW